jgi:glycosyltransferase involved in cell wall biosynthesis
MNILFITQYFPPETGAAPERAMGFAKYLTRAGHRVQVVSGLPNHPASSIHPKYRGKWLVRENFLGISVMRTYTYANPKKRLHHRLLNFFSFGFSCLNALSQKERFDALLLSIPPIFSIPSALFVARLKRIPLILDVRDLWPQAATSLGELKDNFATHLTESLMNMCYRKAAQIAVVTRGIRDALLEAGIAREKIHLITNGVDNEIYHPGSEERGRAVFRALGCEDKFIVLYAGVVGIIHGPWVIGETARLLKDHHDIAFVVIGDGVKKAELEAMKLEYGLGNLYLLGNMQPSNLLPYLQGADLGLSTLQNTYFCEGTIPVKIFSYMACGLPVVFAGRGEGRQIVQDNGAGFCLEAEDPQALAAAVLDLKDNPEQRRSMGKRGVQAVNQRFTRQVLTESLAGVIEQAIRSS